MRRPERARHDELVELFERSTGAALDDGLGALLRAAMELAAPRREAGRAPPFTLECSARLSAQGVERRRYVVAFAANDLGGHPHAAIRRLLAPLRAPPRALAWIDRLEAAGALPSAVIAGVAWADAPADRVGKLYLEQRPLGRVLDEPVTAGPAALALEWRLEGGAPPCLRVYDEIEVPAALDALREGPAAPLLPTLEVRHAWRRRDLDEAAPVSAVQLVVAPRAIAAIAPEIAAVARAVGAPAGAIDGVRQDRLRVLGAGVDRAGRPHVTVYLGLPALPRRPER